MHKPKLKALGVAILVLLLWAVAFPAISLAEEVITVPEAYAASKAGKLLLIDVRSPGEWSKTGIGDGAVPVTIHGPKGAEGFLEKVIAIAGRDPDRAIATICATGVRSHRAAGWLAGIGYRNVANVREGMLGRTVAGEPEQPGWIKRGLPTKAWSGAKK